MHVYNPDSPARQKASALGADPDPGRGQTRGWRVGRSEQSIRFQLEPTIRPSISQSVFRGGGETCLEDEHAKLWSARQPLRDHTATGAGADDDHIVCFISKVPLRNGAGGLTLSTARASQCQQRCEMHLPVTPPRPEHCEGGRHGNSQRSDTSANACSAGGFWPVMFGRYPFGGKIRSPL